MADNLISDINSIGGIEAQKTALRDLADLETKLEGDAAKKIKALRLKAEEDLQKAIDKSRKRAAIEQIEDAKSLQTLRLQHQREIEEAQTRASIEAITAESDLAKQRWENERALAKAKLTNETALGRKIAANGKSYAENIGAAAGKALKAIGQGVEKYMDIYANYMGVIDARLQESGLTFSRLNKQLRFNTAANPYLSYTKTLDNLAKLVEQGVANNTLQRAFLETISDKIATTFSATQESLLQIVRIQQQDTTASRLGLEANLTRLFNYYFSDTSYLSSQFDAIQETLLGVSAQLGTRSSIEFEYIVQKWLGAASSVGVSNSTISKIAQGLSYLGTGNVSALSSDTALQNLLVMAANKGGLNYTEMLTKGVSAKQANQLLYSLIQYVQDISRSNNNVVKAQYAELFGVTLADMVAFNNLSKDMESLYSIGMTYTDTLTELNNQLSNVGQRTHLAEMISNLMENAMAGIGLSIADNVGLYAAYKVADLVESITGGIYIPTIGAMGSFVDLNMSLEGLAKSGIIGFGAVAQLLNVISSLQSGGGLNLDNWLVDSLKGQGFAGGSGAGNLLNTTSNISYVSSTSSTGTSQSLVDQQTQTGTTITGKEETDSSEVVRLITLIADILSNTREPINVNIVDNNF